MSREYTVTVTQKAITYRQILLKIENPASSTGGAIAVRSLVINQETIAGNASDEQFTITIATWASTSTFGGSGSESSITPVPIDPGEIAATTVAATGEAGQDADSGASTPTSERVLFQGSFNKSRGFNRRFDSGILLSKTGASFFIVELRKKPVASTTFSLTAVIDEVGDL